MLTNHVFKIMLTKSTYGIKQLSLIKFIYQWYQQKVLLPRHIWCVVQAKDLH